MQNTDTERYRFICEAVQLAREAVERGGGPFGAVVVRNGQVIGRGRNSVAPRIDPTAHAEVQAIRDACAGIGDFNLAGCELYTSCQPCPMCLGATYWANISRVYYAATSQMAGEVGLRDEFIYDELALPPEQRAIPLVQLPDPEIAKIMRNWAALEDKTEY